MLPVLLLWSLRLVVSSWQRLVGGHSLNTLPAHHVSALSSLPPTAPRCRQEHVQVGNRSRVVLEGVGQGQAAAAGALLGQRAAGGKQASQQGPAEGRPPKRQRKASQKAQLALQDPLLLSPLPAGAPEAVAQPGPEQLELWQAQQLLQQQAAGAEAQRERERQQEAQDEAQQDLWQAYQHQVELQKQAMQRERRQQQQAAEAAQAASSAAAAAVAAGAQQAEGKRAEDLQDEDEALAGLMFLQSGLPDSDPAEAGQPAAAAAVAVPAAAPQQATPQPEQQQEQVSKARVGCGAGGCGFQCPSLWAGCAVAGRRAGRLADQPLRRLAPLPSAVPKLSLLHHSS
jgi:hypothetical protein